MGAYLNSFYYWEVWRNGLFEQSTVHRRMNCTRPVNFDGRFAILRREGFSSYWIECLLVACDVSMWRRQLTVSVSNQVTFLFWKARAVTPIKARGETMARWCYNTKIDLFLYCSLIIRAPVVRLSLSKPITALLPTY